MNLLEIALFKRYTHNKGIDKRFMGSYRSTERIPDNPTSIEKFLLEADSLNVFMTAFYFIPNSDNGYDFWNEHQQNFLDYMESYVELAEDNLMRFRGIYKYLKQNWDRVEYWKSESKRETARRCGIKMEDMIRYEHDSAITFAANTLGVSKETIKEVVNKNNDDKVNDDDNNKNFHGVSDEEFALQKAKEDNEYDPLAEFELATLVSKKEGHRRLKDNEISYNSKNKGWRITFNQSISKTIKARGGYEYATIGRNKNGDVMLMLNDANGVPMQDCKKENASISSKVLCQKLEEYLDIKEQYLILKIKEIAKTDDYVAYLVTK